MIASVLSRCGTVCDSHRSTMGHGALQYSAVIKQILNVSEGHRAQHNLARPLRKKFMHREERSASGNDDARIVRCIKSMASNLITA